MQHPDLAVEQMVEGAKKLACEASKSAAA